MKKPTYSKKNKKGRATLISTTLDNINCFSEPFNKSLYTTLLTPTCIHIIQCTDNQISTRFEIHKGFTLAP